MYGKPSLSLGRKERVSIVQTVIPKSILSYRAKITSSARWAPEEGVRVPSQFQSIPKPHLRPCSISSHSIQSMLLLKLNELILRNSLFYRISRILKCLCLINTTDDIFDLVFRSTLLIEYDLSLYSNLS